MKFVASTRKLDEYSRVVAERIRENVTLKAFAFPDQGIDDEEKREKDHTVILISRSIQERGSSNIHVKESYHKIYCLFLCLIITFIFLYLIH